VLELYNGTRSLVQRTAAGRGARRSATSRIANWVNGTVRKEKNVGKMEEPKKRKLAVCYVRGQTMDGWKI
jgi:hypothetical protein